MRWKTRRRTLDLADQSVIMGILNVTPDSFSDGGEYFQEENAMKHALQMIDEGAEIIDIGGESTRPGSQPVSVEEEMLRTVPVIKALREKSDVLISIDTSKASVAKAALEAGADIVNDVTGLLGDADMAQVCMDAQAGVCVMHMQGKPETMQEKPSYNDVLSTVQEFFNERLKTLTALGMAYDAICFDPGIGFGKSTEHNLTLLRNLGVLQTERPLLLGVSRKSIIGKLLENDSPENRDIATAAITALAHQEGVRLHRVHNILANKQSLTIAEVINNKIR